MLFRNLTLFRFPESALPADVSALEAMLSEAALRPVGAMELASHGFVSPYGRGEPVHALVQPDAILVAYGAEGGAINQVDVESMKLQMLGLSSTVKTLDGRLMKVERHLTAK